MIYVEWVDTALTIAFWSSVLMCIQQAFIFCKHIVLKWGSYFLWKHLERKELNERKAANRRYHRGHKVC